MKPWITLAGVMAFVAITQTPADDTEPGGQPVIECHGTKVVLFSEGVSGDGGYAVGWSIRGHPKVKPVDWSLYSKLGADGFTSKYLLEPIDADVSNYDFENYFVDVRRKTALLLPAQDPYWWRDNHSELGIYWSRGTALPRYCLVQNQKRFATENLYLVKMDKAGISGMDLVPRLEKAVRAVLRAKRPVYYKIMAVSYPNSEWDDEYEKPVFHASTLEIQFNADLPKSEFDKVTGRVVLSLPEGNLLKLTCDAKPDDPFRDNPALAAANAQLNAAYALLEKRLAPPQMQALRKKQLEWLGNRDDEAAGNYPIAGQEIDFATYTQDRDAELVKTTKERTAVLKKLLAR